MSKKVVIIFLIIVTFLVAVIVVFNVYILNQEKKLNDLNIQNTNVSPSENNIQASENKSQEILNKESENMNSQSEDIKVNLIVNNKIFLATLDNNETTKELISMFPMTLNMSDLNSNEKYNYLDTSLPTNSSIPSRINAGDIKLYSNNCLVIFYESFSNSYSYTDLGRIDDVSNFISELGRGSVSIRFELAK